jgi:tetratricopeptide (TPR) repeat protein
VLLVIILSLATLAPPKVDVQGEVTAPGRLEAPATVRLFSGTTAVQTVLADRSGHFKFKKIDPGTYTVHVECFGFYSQDLPVQVVDSNSRISITLQPTPDNPSTTAAIDPFREFDIPGKAKKEYELGIREQRDGKCEVRLTHLQKAVELYPQYAEAFTEIGRCYLQMNDLAYAETAFKKAAGLSREVYPTVNLATLYVSEGRLNEAQALITPLLKTHPTEGELYAAMARIYSANGQLKEAISAGLEAHARGHQSPDIHLLLAKIYESQGNREAMLTQLLNYLDENPHGAAADEVRRQLDALHK